MVHSISVNYNFVTVSHCLIMRNFNWRDSVWHLNTNTWSLLPLWVETYTRPWPRTTSMSITRAPSNVRPSEWCFMFLIGYVRSTKRLYVWNDLDPKKESHFLNDIFIYLCCHIYNDTASVHSLHVERCRSAIWVYQNLIAIDISNIFRKVLYCDIFSTARGSGLVHTLFPLISIQIALSWGNNVLVENVMSMAVKLRDEGATINVGTRSADGRGWKVAAVDEKATSGIPEELTNCSFAW